MTEPIAKLAGSEESHTDSLVRGGIGFLGGLLLCGAALIAQAALLQSIAGSSKKAN
jgi:hypothetical protein